MLAVYKNRYNDVISFVEEEDGTISMHGGNFYRYGLASDNETIEFIDPSGGPYIDLGFNLKMYFKDDVDRVIESIDISNGNIILKIKA